MPVFLFTENKSGVVYQKKRKEYPWQVPWILVNKVYSKMRVASCLYDEWQTDGWRDDKNMKIASNVENNDALHLI